MARKSDPHLTDRLSTLYGVPALNLADFDIDPDILALIPAPLAYKHQVVPVNFAQDSLIVAFANPADIYAIRQLERHTGRCIEVVVADAADVQKTLRRYYPAAWA